MWQAHKQRRKRAAFGRAGRCVEAPSRACLCASSCEIALMNVCCLTAEYVCFKSPGGLFPSCVLPCRGERSLIVVNPLHA